MSTPDPGAGAVAAASTAGSRPRLLAGTPLYPLLFAVFPALALYRHNQAHHLISVLPLPILASLALAALILALAVTITRDPEQAAVRAFTVLFCFFAAGHAHRSLAGLPIGVGRFELDLGWLVPAVIAGLCVGLLVARLPPNLQLVSRLLGAFSVAAVAIAGTGTAKTELARAWSTRALPRVAQHRGAVAADPAAPHVFYILPDAYGRADVLERLYRLDNRPFVQALQERGFYVAQRARANYGQTIVSLASSLNMAYIDELGWTPGGLGQDTPRFSALINASRVAEILRARGYAVTAFATGYTVAEMRSADRFEDPCRPAPWQTPFAREFFDLTPAAALVRHFGGRCGNDSARRRVLFALERAAALAREPTPQFVFAHVVCPHPPFSFDAAGRRPKGSIGGEPDDDDALRPLAGMRDVARYRALYADQVRFLNGRLLALVDEIRQHGSRPAAIVIQADHGPGIGMDASVPDLTERMSILSAVRLAGVESTLYPTLTPVNTLRLLLSRQFGLDLPKLEDRSYTIAAAGGVQLLPLHELPDGRLRPE